MARAHVATDVPILTGTKPKPRSFSAQERVRGLAYTPRTRGPDAHPWYSPTAHLCQRKKTVGTDRVKHVRPEDELKIAYKSMAAS